MSQDLEANSKWPSISPHATKPGTGALFPTLPGERGVGVPTPWEFPPTQAYEDRSAILDSPGQSSIPPQVRADQEDRLSAAPHPLDPMLFQILFKFDSSQAEAVNKFKEMLSRRCFEKIRAATDEPTPQLLNEKDVDMMKQLATNALADNSSEQHKRRIRANIDAKRTREASDAMSDSITKAAKYDINCSICGFYGGRHCLMPMRPLDRDWKSYSRICFPCARGERKPTSEPWLAEYVGFAKDNTPGTDSIRKDRFPAIMNFNILEEWGMAIPSPQEIAAIKTKSFNRPLWTITWRWDFGQNVWRRSTFMPDASYAKALDAWEKTCRDAWGIRQHQAMDMAKRARGTEWKDMLEYFAEVYPDMSRSQQAKHGAARAAMLVTHAIETLLNLDTKTMSLVMRAFKLYENDVDISAIDIGLTLNDIEKDLMDSAYCLGFATKMMEDMYEEWVCRNPECLLITAATEWLRNITATDPMAIMLQHGQFMCPACCRIHRPWQAMPTTEADWKKVREGTWPQTSMIPANKAWVIRDNAPGDANRRGSAAGSAKGKDGSHYLIFLSVWPDMNIQRLQDRMKVIAMNLAKDPPKSRQELAMKIYDKAHLMQDNHTVQFVNHTMSKANIAYVEEQNARMTKGHPWRLDLAKDITGQVKYKSLQCQFVPGVTGVMTQDEIITIWLLIKTQFLAAINACERCKL